MSGFLRGSLQSLGLLTAMAGCAFLGSTRGNAKAMLVGCLGLGVYFAVAVAAGRTYIYTPSRGRQELSREDKPLQFWIFIAAGIFVIVAMAIKGIRILSAA
jgi:hypothetical protein